jgi:hypothetical protein
VRGGSCAPRIIDFDEARQLARLVERGASSRLVLLNTVNDPSRSIVHTVAHTVEHVHALNLHTLVEGRLSTGAELA